MSATNTKYIVGIFDDEEDVLHAIPHIKESGVKIHEVFTPFPVHGLDEVLGYQRSRIDIVAFLFGLTGFLSGLTMISYMLSFDWPMNIGGKSNMPFPDFIPVTFELTVLFTAFGMVITFLIISGLTPWTVPQIFDIRGTDDKFVMAIDLAHNKLSDEQIKEVLTSNGATEVNYKEFKS
ncbi:MAG: hypothetical protein RLZZ175_1661 [Bacteroidota bacterium]|jgi:hypothetical protein